MRHGAPPVMTILLLEDNPVVRQLLGLFLRFKGGYRVIEAGTYREAVAQIEQRRCEVDLLIADVCMGEEDGRAVAQQVMELCPHLRVLFISGYPKDHLVETGTLEPEDEFLAKPFAADALVRRVGEILNGPCEIPAMPVQAAVSAEPALQRVAGSAA